MEFSFIICDGFLKLTIFCEFTSDKIEGFFDALIAHKRWKPGGFLLVDETEFDAGSLTISDMYKVAQTFENNRITLGTSKNSNTRLSRNRIRNECGGNSGGKNRYHSQYIQFTRGSSCLADYELDDVYWIN